jgi:hypothetical protein
LIVGFDMNIAMMECSNNKKRVAIQITTVCTIILFKELQIKNNLDQSRARTNCLFVDHTVQIVWSDSLAWILPWPFVTLHSETVILCLNKAQAE